MELELTSLDRLAYGKKSQYGLYILVKRDNQTMIVKVNIFKHNMESSRHVKRRLKTSKKFKNSGVLALDYVQMYKNLANPFTKGLSENTPSVSFYSAY